MSGINYGIGDPGDAESVDGSGGVIALLKRLRSQLGGVGALQFVDELGVPWGVKHIDNKLRTSSKPYTYDIAEGLISSHGAIRRFGHNAAVAATDEMLWEYSTPYTYTAVAATMYISSSDNGDGQSYQVQGLDANWEVQTQLVTAAGQTKTEIGTGLTWLRIFKVKNMGTTDNAGAVYVYENDTLTAGVPDTATKVRSMIGIGENESHTALFTVPAGQQVFVTTWYGSEVAAKVTYFTLWVRPFGGVFQYKRGWAVKEDSFLHQFTVPLVFPAKTDIEMRVRAVAGAGIAQGGFDGWREDV